MTQVHDLAPIKQVKLLLKPQPFSNPAPWCESPHQEYVLKHTETLVSSQTDNCGMDAMSIKCIVRLTGTGS